MKDGWSYLAWRISNSCASGSVKKARSSHGDSAGESRTEPRGGGCGPSRPRAQARDPLKAGHWIKRDIGTDRGVMDAEDL